VANGEDYWIMNKNISASLLFALVVQAAMIVWSISQMRADVDANYASIVRISADVKAVEASTNIQAVQLGKIEENIKGIKESLERMLEVMERK
tara:strand:+ start:27781 stop:28059 length:279 start_codon:yes stop_codon:yes gene_type:complete